METATRKSRRMRWTETNPTLRGAGALLSLALAGIGFSSCRGPQPLYSEALSQVTSEQLDVSTLAGFPGTTGREDGPRDRVRWNRPSSLTLDLDGSLLIADVANHCIRRLDERGNVSTVANPTGKPGNRDGPFPYAQLQHPAGLALAFDRSLFIADATSHRIRRLTKLGRMETYAGSGESGWSDGPLLIARFHEPRGLALHPLGDLLVADTGNHCVRRISPERMTTTLAGTSEPGFRDGMGESARFRRPTGIAEHPSEPGVFFVADAGNHAIRRIESDGTVSTVAGDGEPGLRDGSGTVARFHSPRDLTVDLSGIIYVADRDNHCIRRIGLHGDVKTLAGGPDSGHHDGPGARARFLHPEGVHLNRDGLLFVADTGNHVLRCLVPRVPTPPR